MLAWKNLSKVLAIAALLAPSCNAEDPRDAGSGVEDTAALRAVVLKANAHTKLALVDQFWSDFQRAGLIPWVYDEICRSLEATGQLDRAFATAEKLLALDQGAIEIAHRALNIAEKEQDPALAKKWSAIAAGTANRVLASPGGDESRTKLARSVRAYTEYVDYSAMLGTSDPIRRREQAEEFLERNKQSPYRFTVENIYIESWRDSGDARNTLGAARKVLENNDGNVVALTIVAENYQQGEHEPRKLMAYGAKILTLLDKQPKPEGLTTAAWSAEKAKIAARAHWMVGSASIQQEKYPEADRSIRAALPYLKNDGRLTSIALFYLGWANYQMGKIPDAIRFNKECMLVKGPYREQAARNLETIRAETTSRN